MPKTEEPGTLPGSPEAPPTALVPAGPPTPLSLLQAMIEKGIEPSALEKMMDLSERYQRGEAEKAFNLDMTEAQAELPVVVRDAMNTHTKSRYARLETVNAAIRPVITRHGFALSFGTETPVIEGTLRVRADVLHRGGFMRSYFADVPLDGQGIKGNANMTATQGYGSTLAYARRYVTLLVFNVSIADEDTDAVGQLVTKAQLVQINDALVALRDAGRPVDFNAFKAWLQVEELDRLPQRGVDLALDYLSKKLNAKPKEQK